MFAQKCFELETSLGSVKIVKRILHALFARNVLKTQTIKGIESGSKQTLVAAVIVETLMAGKSQASAKSIKVSLHLRMQC